MSRVHFVLFLPPLVLVGMIQTIMQLLAGGAVPSQPHSDPPESITTTAAALTNPERGLAGY